jgi:hypothetical protein
MVNRKIVVVVLGLLVGLITQTVCAQAPEPENDVPVKVSFQVVGGPSYSNDIQPIFDEYCVTCHGSIVAENGLRLDDYDHVMKGTRYGSVVMPGKSSFSTLVYVLDGTASEEIAMPHAGAQLSQNRLTNIKYWIDAGAKDN